MTYLNVGNYCRVDTGYEVGTTCLVSKQLNNFLAVCQALRDISCVNPLRTPKAFKGKGSALSQGVTFGLRAVSSAFVGAGA